MSKQHYSKLFLSLIAYMLIFTVVPMFLVSVIKDTNLVLMITALISIVPVCLAMGKEEFLKQLREKRERPGILLFLAFLLAPTAINIIGGLVGEAVKSSLGFLGLQVTETVKQMSEEVVEAPSLMLFLYTGIIAPVFEEFAFRNYLLRTIEKPRPWLAVILAGILFGIMHSNIDQGIRVIPLGMYFSYLALRYSMWVPIAAHAGNNTLFYLLSTSWVTGFKHYDNIMLTLMISGLISLIVLIVSALQYAKRHPGKTEEKATYTKNPFLWVYVALCMLLIIVNEFVL